ncbi:MAG: hypothetical protein WAN43_10785 [Rhodomicrobium sp.]
MNIGGRHENGEDKKPYAGRAAMGGEKQSDRSCDFEGAAHVNRSVMPWQIRRHDRHEKAGQQEKLLPPCPCCGERMIVIEFFERGMQPRYRAPSLAIWFDTS